jgi:LCP family protein required for cell wall assembly
VLVSGGATAVLALNEVSKIVEALRQSKPVKLKPNTLAPTSQGAPETLLLVGNDERPPPKNNPAGAVEPHSNEMLLVRIDPSQPTISMLSIPRELQVTFTTPNGQVITNRINSAYTYGYEEGHGTTAGVQLMLETIKRLLGLTVNHVFVTSFPKFKRAVTEMGCVYMTVDHRYYHVNEPGGEQYFEINLQPGYQQLCGRQALEFVANRHEDTSLTRDARDQRFLLSVKGQYGPGALENRDKLERIFGRAVETDSALHSTDQVLQLIELLAESAGKPVRQVPFHVNLLPTYDTASEQQIQEAVSSFLRGTGAIPKHALDRSVPTTHLGRPAQAASLGMTPAPEAMLAEARSLARRLPFALQAPRYQLTSAMTGGDLLRRYDISGPGNRLYPAFVIAVDRGGLGEYYDVQGTTWTEPPLLGGPTAKMRVGSRTYGLYYDGEHIRTIAWHEGGAVYWIENTLTNGLSPRDMVALARETVPVSGQTAPAVRPPQRPAAGVVLPGRSTATPSAIEKIGAGIGFLLVSALAILSTFVVRRQRVLKLLRMQVAHALALEESKRSALAAVGVPLQQGTSSAHVSPAVDRSTAPPAQPAHAGSQTAGMPPGAPGERAVYRARRRPRLRGR